MSRPRSASSPVRGSSGSSGNGRIAPRSVTQFSSIPEEDEEVSDFSTAAGPTLSMSPTRRVSTSSMTNTAAPRISVQPSSRTSSLSSLSTAQIPRHQSNVGAHGRPLTPSISSTTSRQYTTSRLGSNPRPLPRPANTISTSARPGSPLRNQSFPQSSKQPLQHQHGKQEPNNNNNNSAMVTGVVDDTGLEQQQEQAKKVEEVDLEKIYMDVIKSSVIQRAIESLQEMQNALAVSSFRSTIWETEAYQNEKTLKKTQIIHKEYEKRQRKRNLVLKETVELLDSKLRESIRLIHD